MHKSIHLLTCTQMPVTDIHRFFHTFITIAPMCRALPAAGACALLLPLLPVCRDLCAALPNIPRTSEHHKLPACIHANLHQLLSGRFQALTRSRTCPCISCVMISGEITKIRDTWGISIMSKIASKPFAITALPTTSGVTTYTHLQVKFRPESDSVCA